MQLEPGSRLGPYEILSLIGAGGMGEVYKAKDTRLDRTVAIKVLPSHLAESPERRERFEREARAVSSLNHPNICTLHDIGEQDGTHFLVMEYIEGETLADRLTKGPLPLDQALRYGIEIADALDKAHRQGVVHRDLKPGNMMLTKMGPKLLDFGLAKLRGSDLGQVGSELSALPTEQKPLTKEGSILGTFQYMAPEQLEGKEADARTDIFAFGSVLYEMVTGKRAFEGKSQASLISAIMSSEPSPIPKLQPMTPPALEHTVKSCLTKDPDERWQTAGDVGRQLRWVAEGDYASGASTGIHSARRISARLASGIALGLLAGVLITSFFVWSLRPPPPPRPMTRFGITLPADQPLTSLGSRGVALSPDGTHLVYVANYQLNLRAMDQMEATPIPGTGGIRSERSRSPFFSPDGEWIVFNGENALKKISIRGGAPITLCDAQTYASASWGPDDTIVFSQRPGGISRVSANGGTPEILVSIDATKGEMAYGPQILPDGKTLLFTLLTSRGVSQESRFLNWDKAQIVAQSLETGERRVLIEAGTDGRYVPTGHVVYALGETLLAVPFNLERLEVTGGSVPVIEGVRRSTFGVVAQFDFSENGSLVFLTPGKQSLVWVDRMGREEPLGAEGLGYRHPRVSPDGTRVAVSILDGEGGRDIYIYDLERRTPTRLTFDPANEDSPLWTADGQSVVFRSSREGGGIFRRRADGTGDVERLTTESTTATPFSLSRDGTVLVFGEIDSDTRDDLYTLPLEAGSSPAPLLQTEFDEEHGALSPDGRWLAYTTDEAGQEDIYVRPFPNVDDRKWRISTVGAREPLWGPDGSELFYRGSNGVMLVRVETEPAFRAGTPEVLFEGPYGLGGGVTYDLAPDGRFVMIRTYESSAPTQINVVLNWFEELERRVPTGN